LRNSVRGPSRCGNHCTVTRGAKGRCWIGVDIGATKILGCVVAEHGEVIGQRVVNTPLHDEASIEDALFDTIHYLWEGNKEVEAVGISLAGWLDRQRRTVLFSPHLPWRREPLAERLSDRLGLAVVLENDANAAAWGEFQFGAGREFSEVAVVIVGSGVGAGFVVDGKLLRGAHGMAGEFGHTVVDPNGPNCPCGRRGCVDSLASGRALERRFNVLRQRGQNDGSTELGRLEQPVMGGEQIAVGARNGDPLALEAFKYVGTWLGMAVADLVMYIDPEAVILAGGVGSSGELVRRPTDEAMRRSLAARSALAKTYVLSATLGPAAGAIGVAHLASAERAGQPA
jgi:glucokinase